MPGRIPGVATEPAVPRTFSIVIPALDEERNIASLLEDISGQELGGFHLEKIVVVSDGSTDRTAEIVESRARDDSRVELVVNERRQGNAQAINIGKSMVESDVLVILDGDIRLDGGATLRTLLDGMQPGVGIAGGNPRPVRDSDSFASAINECGALLRDDLRNRIRGGNNVISALGCILALDRALYADVEIPLDPVSPELLVPNDQYFYMKCLERGLRFVSIEDARVYYRLCDSVSDTNRQGVRFVFSMRSMDSFFDERLLKQEYSFPVGQIMKVLADSMARRPIATLAWGALHVYVRVKVFVMRHVLKGGVNAAWEVSRTSKGGITTAPAARGRDTGQSGS